MAVLVGVLEIPREIFTRRPVGVSDVLDANDEGIMASGGDINGRGLLR